MYKKIFNQSVTQGASPLDQNFWFEFPDISSCVWKNIFWNFQERGQLCKVYRNFEGFLAGISVPINFAPGISGIFGWMLHILEIQQFLNFSGNLPGKFPYHLTPFWKFGICGQMGSVHNLLGKIPEFSQQESNLYSCRLYELLHTSWHIYDSCKSLPSTLFLTVLNIPVT